MKKHKKTLENNVIIVYNTIRMVQEMKNDLIKTIIVRIVGVVCIVAALLVLMLPTSLKMDGVKSKAIKEMSRETEADLDAMQSRMLMKAYEYEDELEDNDLPTTQSGIKRMFKNAKSVVKGIVKSEYSLYGVYEVMGKLPKYVEDFGNLADLNDAQLSYIIGENEYMRKADIEDIDDVDNELELVANVVRGLFIAIAVLCVLAAISCAIGRLSAFKHLYFVVICAVVGLVGGLVVVTSGGLTDVFTLPENFEDAMLNITATPFVAVALSFVPIVLDLIFKNKKHQIKGEKENGIQ
jgi:hypothetical protein